MSVGRICVRDVDTAEAGEPVQVAAARMCDRKVGTLIVVGEGRRPIGILTDRDLAVRVVAHSRDAAGTTVEEVMTRFPATVREETPIEMAIQEMRQGPFRRLPVVDDDGCLVGLISLDDILDLLTEEFNEIGELLRREGPASLAGSE